jgi:ABC-type enterochelin transport system substrate-binding protein
MRSLLKMSLLVLLMAVIATSCKNGEEKKEAPMDTVKAKVDTASSMPTIDTNKKVGVDSAPIIRPGKSAN